MGIGAGRRAVVAEMLGDRLADCARSGAGAVIRITGEAGIGKTTLVESLLDRAQIEGLSTWTAQAADLDHSSPYGLLEVVVSASGDLLFEAAVFQPDSGQRGPGGVMTSTSIERFRVAESVLEIAEAAFRKPSLLVLEDVHWADAASVDAIGAIARACGTGPLVLIVTRRPTDDPIQASLDESFDALNALDVLLGPLHPDEVTDLLTAAGGGPPSTDLLARAEGAAGNPFLLHEYVNGLMGDAEHGLAHRVLAEPASSVPPQFRRAVSVEVERLGIGVSEVIRAAAVQGSFIDLEVLSDVTQRTAVSLDEPLRRCVTAGLLEEHADGWQFRHDLVRQAVYEDMPGPIRRTVHRQIAGELARRNAPAALVGSHLVLGDSDGDAETIDRLHRAATETSLLAPDAALGFLDRARELATDDVGVRRLIERARLDALTAAGRIEEAEAVANWLLGVAGADEKADIHARLGGLASIAGEVPKSLEHLSIAIELADGPVEGGPILAMAAIASATNFDYAEAARLATEAVEVGQRVGEPVGHSAGLALLARMSTYDSTVDEGLRLGAEAVAIADTDPAGVAHEYIPCLHYGMTAFDADRLDVALDMADRGRRLASESRMMWAAPHYGSLAAAVFLRRGEVDRAHAEAEAAIEMAERTNSRQTQLWTESVLCLASLELGDDAAAGRWSRSARESFESGRSSLGNRHLALAVAKVAELEDGAAAALASLAESWDLFEASGLVFCQPLLAFDLARLARCADDTERVEAATAVTEKAGATNGVPAIVALGRWLRARLDEDAAEAQRALADLKRTERQLEVAAWLVDGAQLLGGGNPSASLREALAIYEDLGAAGPASRLRRQLAGQRGIDDAPRSGWSTLTRSENDIVRLLAEGFTNAEIAQQRNSSRRTIESHLRQVYRKLEIDGRTRLVSVAAAEFKGSGDTRNS